MKLLVTGANGFVGRALCDALRRNGHEVAAGVRRPCGLANEVNMPALDADWAIWESAQPSLTCDVVVHLAARVHVMHAAGSVATSLYRSVNTIATLTLARAAANAGVQRFVFLSSIKVNGEGTSADQPFTAAESTTPQDPYGISKMEAEQGLRHIAAESGMEVVIVRPPLVYGPGVKANFASMMRAVQRGIPLPLASVTHNRRSFVALDNLVDLLITCIDHPAAANQTFVVSDGEDLSTADLLRRLGHAMDKPARLFPAPPLLLQLCANVLGKGDMAQRLLGNLQVDISHTRDTLNWSPPISVDEGLRRAVAGLTP
jgi:nucleoside-diphosphate-sugar epimerase